MGPHVLGITGASGAIYGLKALELLLSAEHDVAVIITAAGRKRISQEMALDVPADPAGQVDSLIRYWVDRAPRRAIPERIRRGLSCYPPEDLSAPLATGAFATGGMIIVPCEMSTVADIAAGRVGDLLERAAEVTIKERRPLVVVPREAPLSPVHLRNLLTLAEMGVHVHPACPSFSGRPKDISGLAEAVARRALAGLGVDLEAAEERAYSSPRRAQRYS